MLSLTVKFGFALAAMLVNSAAWSQSEWPTKSIEFVSTGSPGSASDIYFNIIKEDVQTTLGQPLVLINKPGAGAQIGGLYVARSAPDGYTVLITHTALQATGPSIYKDLQYDPVKDLAAVARISQAQNFLYVLKDSPIKDVNDLIARAKTSGPLTYASTGIGTVEHLSAVLFSKAAGIEVTHVPYQGTAAALQGMLSGEGDFAFTNPSVLGEHMRSGRVRALAVASSTRSDAFPNVPTLDELGIKNVIAESWYGFSVAANTPKPVIDKLAAALISAMEKPKAQDQIKLLGTVPATQGPQEFDQYVKAEFNKWKPVIEASGASAQ